MTFFPPVLIVYIFCNNVFPFEYVPHQYAKCVNDYHDCAAKMPGMKCIEEMERKQCERGMMN